MLEPKFFPFPALITKRLILDRMDTNDAPALLQLRSSQKVMAYIDKERIKTMEETLLMIKRINDDITNNDGITWRICLNENPQQLVGTIGLWRIIKPHYRAEVGYMLHPDFWNKGLMQEALQAVIDFGFTQMQLHSIEAHINPGNAASAALLQKMQFIREAYFKEDYFFRGKFLDSAVYSLLNKK